MADKAPVVIAEVRGFDALSGGGQWHYCTRPPGTPVQLEREPTNQGDSNTVNVRSACCGVVMGQVDPENVLTLAKWMDKGWIYEASVKNKAITANAYNCVAVMQHMTVRCVPIQPKAVFKTVAKEKEVEDA